MENSELDRGCQNSIPMKVCFICNEYPPVPHGGIGSLIQVLGRELVQRGHEVRIAGMYPGDLLNPVAGISYPRYEEDQGVRVWRLPMGRKRFDWIRARRALYRLLADWAEKGDIDLVDVQDWEGWAAGWPKLKVPVISRLNGSAYYFSQELNAPAHRTSYWLERASLRRSDFLCSASRYTAERTKELFDMREQEIKTVYNSVDAPAKLPRSKRSPSDVIFTGTLAAKKGVISLVRAWPIVKQAVPEAQLHLHGKDTIQPDGSSMKNSLKSQIPIGLRDSVEFNGHTRRPELMDKLKSARVAVFPSYVEAFAMAPLEAMAQGCPTIYSTRGSGPEAIQDGVDGFLVDPHQPEKIAAAIIRVLKDNSLAERIGAAGHKRILRDFTIARVAGTNEQFFAECVDRYGHDGRGSRN